MKTEGNKTPKTPNNRNKNNQNKRTSKNSISSDHNDNFNDVIMKSYSKTEYNDYQKKYIS